MILKLLEEWPEWRELREAPARIAALEKEVGALQQSLARLKRCTECGGDLRPKVEGPGIPSFSKVGRPVASYLCTDCGFGTNVVDAG